METKVGEVITVGRLALVPERAQVLSVDAAGHPTKICTAGIYGGENVFDVRELVVQHVHGGFYYVTRTH